MRVFVRPRRPKAEEAHGPPLDKGVLAVHETLMIPVLKTVGNLRCYLRFHAK
ncbi:hypothetical protein [Peribacillus muralis]|uniref:hypothetical protein n=1 Tax=Peribacillus muralis TaxID=264697 RepID=UPI00366C5FCA